LTFYASVFVATNQGVQRTALSVLILGIPAQGTLRLS